MARRIISRLLLSGRLVAKTPLHVGGYGDDVDTDLPLARDGRGDLYVPGSSLAGAIRQWCEEAFGDAIVNDLWGFQKDDNGHASYVFVEDAPVNGSSSVLIEVRDGVGIDRESGAAAENIKYDRAILPSGTKLSFALSAEIENAEKRSQMLAMLASLKEALEKERIRLGASKTRGLGRIALEPGAKFVEQKFNDRAGIFAFLKPIGKIEPIDGINEAKKMHPAKPSPRLVVEIVWKPVGPLMVKSGFDGIAVDMMPLVGNRDGGLSLVLPGSSVKGAFRTQAERIVRTLLRSKPNGEQDPKKKFLRDLDVKLVNDLFGLHGLSDRDENTHYDGVVPKVGPLQGLSALAVDDCFSKSPMSRNRWQSVQKASTDKELCQALKTTGLSSWCEAYHVAVDRWTGAAAESMLYTVLEPHGTEWEPLILEIELSRLAEDIKLPAIALMLLVLRELTQGRLPLGFATHRGMGAVAIEKVTITPHDVSAPLSELRDTEVSTRGIAKAPAELNTAWALWRKGPRDEQ
jgi:CRISPR/Cas system CSM-associated protein Csm3 (group 7 of RAMP superfamily)